jgi:hypothetical protein
MLFGSWADVFGRDASKSSRSILSTCLMGWREGDRSVDEVCGQKNKKGKENSFMQGLTFFVRQDTTGG